MSVTLHYYPRHLFPLGKLKWFVSPCGLTVDARLGTSTPSEVTCKRCLRTMDAVPAMFEGEA